jgi:hypothetical protein
MEYRGRVPVEAPPPAAAQSSRSREPINPFEQRRDERASMLSFSAFLTFFCRACLPRFVPATCRFSFCSILDDFARFTVVSEIEERETFLLEMRDLGQSKPYEARIKGEISEVPTPHICFCTPHSAHDQNCHTA